jgi:hypothetical protein
MTVMTQRQRFEAWFTTQGGAFSPLTDYEARHVIYHLIGAKAVGPLRWLLAQSSESGSNGWFEFKFARGLLTSFFEDLEFVCKNASSPSASPIPLDVYIRAALYHTIRKTLSTIDVSLIRDLRAAGHWNAAQARDVLALRDGIDVDALASMELSSVDALAVSDAMFGRAVQNLSLRGKAYSLQSLLPVLSPTQRRSAFQAMLDAARSDAEFYAAGEFMNPGSNLIRRVRLLLAVAKESEPPERVALALEALQIAKTMDVYDLGYAAVREVAEIGDPELVAPILQAVAEWKETPIAFVLMELAEHMTSAEGELFLERALCELERDGGSMLKCIAVEDIVATLPTRLLDRGLALARSLDDPGERAHTLTALAQRDDWGSAETAVRDALEAIDLMHPDQNVPNLLSSLGTRIPPDSISTVCHSLSRLNDASERAVGFARVLASAWPNDHQFLAEECSKNARQVVEIERANISRRILSIASDACEPVQAQLREVVSCITDLGLDLTGQAGTEYAIPGSPAILPQAESEIQRRFRDAINVNDRKGRVSAQLALIACLLDGPAGGRSADAGAQISAERTSRLMTALRSILGGRYVAADPWDLLRGLSLLRGKRAPLDDAGLLSSMINTANEIEKPTERAEALASIGLWTKDRRAEIFQATENAIREIDDVAKRAEALIALATMCGQDQFEPLFSEAAQLLGNIANSDRRIAIKRWLTRCRSTRDEKVYEWVPPPHLGQMVTGWSAGVAERQLDPSGSMDERGPGISSETSEFSFAPTEFKRVYLEENYNYELLSSERPRWSYDLPWIDGPMYVRALGALAVCFPECLSQLLTEALALAHSSHRTDDGYFRYLEALLVFGEPAAIYVVDMLTSYPGMASSHRNIQFALRHLEQEGRKMLETESKRLMHEVASLAEGSPPLARISIMHQLMEFVPLMEEPQRSLAIAQILSVWEVVPDAFCPWRLLGILLHCRHEQSDRYIDRIIARSANDPLTFLRVVVELMKGGETVWVARLREEAIAQLERVNLRRLVDDFPAELVALVEKRKLPMFITGIYRACRSARQAQSFCALVRALNKPLDLNVLRSCTSNFDGFQPEERATILASVAVRATQLEGATLLNEAMKDALSVYDEASRRETLFRVFHHVSDLGREDQMRTLIAVVSNFDEVGRNELFNRITGTRSVIAAVAAPEIISELICTIEECCQWWP